MQQEKEKEEERKKLGRERREKDRDRDVRDDRIKRIINEGSPGRRLEGSPAFGGNAGGRRSRERSPPRRGDRRRSRERDFDRVARDHRDRGRDRDREMRDRVRCVFYKCKIVSWLKSYLNHNLIGDGRTEWVAEGAEIEDLRLREEIVIVHLC